MGLRGPGAKPASSRPKPKRGRPKLLPWKRAGLSRSERVVAFLEDLPITQGSLAGTKLKVRSWQRDFIEAVYREDDAGIRPVRTAVLSMARKNGKTQLVAGLALCHLCGPEAESRGEVYAAANDRFQAGKTFAEMEAILNGHPHLSARCNISRFRKEITVLSGEGAGSIFVALSADAATKMGLSPSMIVFDELGSAPKRSLYEALDTAMGARDNPLMCVISTQASSDLAIMSELVDYGLKVNAGEIEDDSFHLTLYTAPDDADPWSPATWAIANPALGDFRSLSDVERQATQARRVPSRENSFRNLILNQRVAAHSRFIVSAEWKACGGAVDLDSLKGRPCFGGLDLGATRDLSALALVFPNPDGVFDVVMRFWLPAEGIDEREEAERAPYRTWERQGFVTPIPGVTNDPAWIASSIADETSRYKIKAMSFDRWRIEDLKRELGNIGAKVPLVAFGQGFRDMSPAVDVLERRVAERKLRHGGNPPLAMCASNAVIERDASGNRKLTKARSTGRIDGLVALAMALSVADRHEEQKAPASLRALLGK